jgi:hypothetical protein
MAEEQTFEKLFSDGLAELQSAEQQTDNTDTDNQTVAVEPTDIVGEAVSETEETATEDEQVSAEDEATEETKTSPVAVNEDDVIVLPDGTEVSVKEAALRQRDYTRKTQALAEERKALEAERTQYQSAVDYVNNLQDAWQRNQAEVVSGFVASTADPTLILSQVIVELAKADKLDPKFIETFGITPEVQERWASEVKSQSELQEIKSRLSRFEQERAAVETANAQEAEQSRLIAEYEDQWEQIKVNAKLKLDPITESEEKLALLQYALENEIPNLLVAWKAKQFELSQVKVETKKVNTDAKKAATGAITPKSTGGSVVTAKSPSSIEDAAWQAFQELSNKS